MPIPSLNLQALEDACNRLASETVLAQAGRDDGLIPAYSLLSDLAEVTASQDALAGPVGEVRARLDALLDAALPFDEDSLGALRRLVGWLGQTVDALRLDQPPPPWSGTVAPPATHQAPPPEAAAETGYAEQLLDLNLEENAELLTEFHAEAIDHLSMIESSLLILDEEPDDRDALNQIFRSFHTIKGVSGFLQLTPMHTLTHEVESLLDLARTGQLRLTPTIITAILQSRDAVQIMVNQITAALEQGHLPDAIVPVGHLILTVKALAQPTGTDPVAPPVAASHGEASSASTSAAPLVVAPPVAEARPGAGSSSTVRVNTEKLDAMMNVVGELVIVQSQISESARESANQDTPLARNIAQLGRITKEL
ncbi:MAG: Hpt domain-containing protein, partial [Verrucomicrobiota bacterium]